MAFEYIIFGGIQNFNIKNGNFGGVKVKLLTDTWTEETPKYDIFTKQYQTVKGAFDVLIEGPTASGVLYISRNFQQIANLINRFSLGQTRYSEYLQTPQGNIYFKHAEIKPWDKFTSIDYLKTIRHTFSYERYPYIFRNSLTYPEYFDNVKVNNDSPLTIKGYENRVETPINLVVALLNQSYITPSGYLLLSNHGINTISGGYFTTAQGGSNHITQTNVDENTRFAYSQYTYHLDGNVFVLDVNSGVQKTTPTVLNVPIVSSGTVYGNGTQNLNLFDGGSYSNDVYLVYKTDGNTEYDIELTAQWYLDSVDYATTGTKRVQNSIYPQTMYLGEIHAKSSIERALLVFNITPRTILGGSLYIDRVILHAKDSIHNTVQFNSSQIPSKDIRYRDTLTTPGQLLYEFINGYSSFSYDSRIRGDMISTFRIKRRIQDGIFFDPVAVGIPSYRGDVDLYYKMLEQGTFVEDLASPSTISGVSFPNYDGDSRYNNGHYAIQFVATGSTYNTVSGLNNWVHTDQENQKTQLQTSYSIPYVFTEIS